MPLSLSLFPYFSNGSRIGGEMDVQENMAGQQQLGSKCSWGALFIGHTTVQVEDVARRRMENYMEDP